MISSLDYYGLNNLIHNIYIILYHVTLCDVVSHKLLLITIVTILIPVLQIASDNGKSAGIDVGECASLCTNRNHVIYLLLSGIEVLSS